MKLTRCGNVDGFSLIEMLIAMALSLVLIGAVVQLLIASQSSYQLLLQQARLQERARYALDYIVSDLRQLGYTGCGNESMKVANALALASKDYFTVEQVLLGWESASHRSIVQDHVTDTDVIEMYLLQPDGRLAVVGQTTGINEVTFNLAPGDRFDNDLIGDLMAVVDGNCSNMALFTPTSSTFNSVTATISLPPPSQEPSKENHNCSIELRGDYRCDQLNTEPGDYPVGSYLYPVSHRGYGIRYNTGTFDLWRFNLIRNERLVQGVVDLQVTYGLDTDNDNAAERIVDADTIRTEQGLSFTQAISVNLTLTVSADSQVPGTEPLTADFSTTVYLRNRGRQ